jgi:NAD(P)-dependent dehydrogenase (short-subunit alcohol dehydrogenase family)
MTDLDGRVAIVTGGGRGIGREHAIVLSRAGARVVVNDTGGDPHGDVFDPSVAQQVVDEIRGEGGVAVANTSDVSVWSSGKELVDQAIDTFGNLHVLVNNAGVLRHSQIADMDERDFDRVLAIHLKGHFTTTKHAAAYWRSEAQAGRDVSASIINTASPQGLFGGRNFPEETGLGFGIEMAQSNYDAAKAGILGLTLSCAIELYRYGIRTNALCPFATTRLADLYPGRSPLPPGWPGEDWAPGHPRINSFLAAWLASAGCPANGTVWNPALGSLWTTWTEAGAIPSESRWPTIDEIDGLIRAHIGIDVLTVLGRPPSVRD